MKESKKYTAKKFSRQSQTLLGYYNRWNREMNGNYVIVLEKSLKQNTEQFTVLWFKKKKRNIYFNILEARELREVFGKSNVIQVLIEMKLDLVIKKSQMRCQ